MNNKYDIYCIELATIQKIFDGFHHEYFHNLAKHAEAIIREYDNYWLINNQLMLHNPMKAVDIDVFNAMVAMSRKKCNILMLHK
jgi:predicted transcriptional regulator